MGSITGHFQRETPLHPDARAFLEGAFDRGWADPSKVHAHSREAAILLNQAKEIFADHLKVRVDQVEFLSDPALGFHLGVTGLLRDGSKLFHSAVDRSEVFAISELHKGIKLPVSLAGQTSYPEGVPGDVLVWQSINGETGILAETPDLFSGQIFVDATASAPHRALPERWSTALWNSRTWEGPAGLGVFAIADKAKWRNPLPHFDLRISSSELSIPLVMASAIALEAHARDYLDQQATLVECNTRIREFLITEIGDVDLAGSSESTVPHLISFSLLYIDAERLVNELEREGFSVDSGSACNSANMEPSHVLAAMGLLTHGNIRMTVHNQTTLDQVETLLNTLKTVVEKMRG